MKKFGLILVCITAIGCGRQINNEIKKSSVAARFELGRKVTYNSHAQTGEFGLTGGEQNQVYQIFRDSSGDYISKISFNTEKMPDIAANAINAACETFVAANSQDLGIDTEDLAFDSSSSKLLNDKTLSVYVVRTLYGTPVRDAYVSFVFAQFGDNYRLREVLNRSYGSITLDNNLFASVTMEDAKEIFSDLSVRSLTPMIFPKRSESGNIQFFAATEVELSDEDDTYTVTLRSDTREVLEAYQHKISLGEPELKALAYQRNYLEPDRTDLALPFAMVDNGTVSTTTGPDGEINDPNAIGQVNVTLSSDRVSIFNGNTRYPAIPANIGGNVGYTVDPTGLDQNAVNAFLAVQRINRFVRRHLDPVQVAYLGQDVTVKINVNEGGCNAYFIPQENSLNLLAAGGGCADMSLINDVTYHEWGHGLDNGTGNQPGIGDGAFSEGIGDILSGYKTNSADLAPGFETGSPNAIRSIDNTSRYNPNQQAEVHIQGLIIGGSFWDMRKALVSKYGDTKGAYVAENLFMRHLMNTDTYLDSYDSVVLLDDDDGNPATRSPNFCLINAAFAKHNLAPMEPNCTDAPDTAVVDSDLFVGIYGETSQDSYELMASSAAKTNLTLCVEKRAACLAGQGQMINFKNLYNEERSYYKSVESVKIINQLEATVIVKDDEGNVTGTREIKFVLK
ncbi:MAG: hypothetical protein AB7T49_13040 [Oligoflexales bacterium]